MKLNRRWAFRSLALLSLCSCSLGPDYVRPELDLPDHYSEAVPEGESIANLKWWDFLQDPRLQDLIKIALVENRDLQVAAARIEEARAIVGFTRADQFPHIDGSANASRTDMSDATILFDTKPRNNFGLFADLSFELDIWGKLRRATEAERAQLLATEYAHRSLTISLVSEVANTYLAVMGLEERIKISKKTLKARADATGVIKARFDKGVVPELDLNQAQIEEAEAAIAISTFERELGKAENALGVLLGTPQINIPRGEPLDKQKMPDKIPAEFPAALLERRPDLMQAESVVKSATARIGVAEAEMLPGLDLLGFVGLQSEDIDDIFKRDAFTWQIGGDLVGPLLDFGKSRSNVEIAEAQALQALKSYEQGVFDAVREVDDSLVSIRTYRKELAFREGQVRAARNAVRLSRARYDQGVTSYLEVLDVERSLFEAELGASATRQSYFTSIVILYKALGGGWERPVV